MQEYLDRAPVGINARWAWRQLVGGEGEVGLVDLEQGWIPAHEDIDPELPPLVGDNRHGEGEYRGHHGTAVLGVVAGREGTVGIRGIVGGLHRPRVASHFHRPGAGTGAPSGPGHVAGAIRQALPRMAEGDVLLLEVQRSYLPTEVDPADRDAIRLAVAHGIIVVEAAGNGNANLDRYRDERGERVLDRRSSAFRDSGAIMVAAARAARPHNRFSGRVGVGSNHGSRIDCFAYGNRVVSAGYGDLSGHLDPAGLSEAESERGAYTHSFGGTSAAAPIIAGAALLVQGIRQVRAGTRLSPLEMRRILSNPATGTRQGRGVRGRIGVMPDLKQILRRRLRLVSDLYLRSDPGDRAAAAGGRRAGSSPDIVVAASAAELPDLRAEGYAGLGSCAPGDDHLVCVRLRNRGALVTDDPRVRVFWSEVATLITPALLNELAPQGPAGAVDPVPPGGRPVWSRPFRFRPPARGGKARHFCFTAVVDDPRDGAEQLVVPPDRWPYFDWREYRAFLRHPNVACRNVHLVDLPARATEHRLAFDLTGTPDLARRFDFEIVRGLPPEVALDLESQPAIAERLRRGRLWAAERPADTGPVRLTLPRQPRLLVERVRLVAGAVFPCCFLVGKEAAEGDSVVIRQLYRGREVGRITWLVRRPQRRRPRRRRPAQRRAVASG